MPTLVPLSRDKVAVIDDADAARVLAHKWSYHGEDYACRTIRVQLSDGRCVRRDILLHRFIVDAPDELDVDHEDRDGLNCQRHNLRTATRSQNVANSGSRGGTSRYKGVFYRKERGTWRVEITVNYHKRSVGTFRSEIAAALAYDRAAYAAWPEFAHLNFPEYRTLYQLSAMVEKVHSIPTIARCRHTRRRPPTQPVPEPVR